MEKKNFFNVFVVFFLIAIIILLVLLLIVFLVNKEKYSEGERGVNRISYGEMNITLRNLLKEEIKNTNIEGGNCKDYAEYYNRTFSKKYPELDIRWPRYVDICNNLTLCDNYHTYLVINGYGSECILDHKSLACIELVESQ